MYGISPMFLSAAGEITMSTLLADLSTVVTSVFSWVTTVATTITSTPLLLLCTGFLVLGGAIGIFGRLLSRG